MKVMNDVVVFISLIALYFITGHPQ